MSGKQLAAVNRFFSNNMNTNGSVAVLTDGVQSTVDFTGEKNVRERLAKLIEAGAILFDSEQLETGYWNPAIVTDAKGQASLTFTVPDRSTAWRLMAKGVTVDTLAGEASEELVVKKDLFGQLKLPLAFTDGDRAQIVASLHNTSIDKGQISVTLKTTIGGKSVTETKQIEVNSKGVHDVSFDAALKLPENAASAEAIAQFELTVAAGQRSDVARASTPIRPDGLPVFVTASGAAESDTAAFLEAPAKMPMQSPSLQIIIGPTVERSLLDIVLGEPPACQLFDGRFASGLDTATSDLMAAIAVQRLIGKTRQGAGPDAAALDGRIRAALSLLISSQNKKGYWTWTGAGLPDDRYASARALWALGLAREAGYHVPDDQFGAAKNYVAGQIASTPNTDYESKAVLLHALASVGQGDFTLANRLYRVRPSLSNAALAYLALAFAEMNRGPVAGELLNLLAQRNLDQPAGTPSLTWNQSATEIRALIALASLKVSPEAAADNKKQIEWLMAHRHGYRWRPEKATGPAALAVGEYYTRNPFVGQRYKLEVFVNDNLVQTLDVRESDAPHVVEAPAKFLNDKKQRVSFQLTGRARFTYQCVYGGFVPADKLQSTTDQWQVTRRFQPPRREVDGQFIPRGFDVLQGEYNKFENPLTQLPVGKRAHVSLEIHRRTPTTTRSEEREYLVVTEPLPCGATVIEDSVHGGYERYELSPGAITFYLGASNAREVGYDIHGYAPGAYHAAPTVVRDAYRPDQFAVAKAKALTVLPLGAESSDVYRLTPRELYELGQRRFALQDYAGARVYLSELFKTYRLKPDFYKRTVRMLLESHLATGPAADVVRYFEIQIEKWPEEDIPLDMIPKIGAAYHTIGEYERSFLVFRAGVEGSFATESHVGGFLEGQGEFVRSVNVMNRLLAEYPPEPYLAAATYALAQRVYAKAGEAAQDEKLRAQKILGVDLVRRAAEMLDNFLTAYPEDPADDEAAFSVGVALLELEAYQTAVDACQRYAVRYAKSDFLDRYWYTIGYARFALGEHEAALAMCRKVAQAKFTDPQTGRETESDNKWRAIYIMGQVYHSLGQAADAIREYQRVEDRFPDARQAIEYFAHKNIALPEVTTVKPNEQAGVKLSFRNLPACDVRVYRIDLMKFSLLRRNLEGISKINLAGIRPTFSEAIKLGDGKDYRDRERELKLPLKGEGAYLVVCRGGDMHASGLVLVTPLEVQVQQEASSGRVRATVKNDVDEHFVPKVHVKVIGTRNADFHSGDTDLRGVFVADGIRGRATIVAQADGGRYAFFRGETELGPPPEQTPPAPSEAASPKPSSDMNGEGKGGELLEGLKQGNSMIQGKQQEKLQDLYEPSPGGFGGGGFF